MARLGGAFAQGERDRSQLLEVLGPPPTDDPMKALLYAQNVLVLTMKDIAEDPSIEPERRWKLLADLAAKVGMTHSRAVVQQQINTVKKRLGQSTSESVSTTKSLTGVERPKTARTKRASDSAR